MKMLRNVLLSLITFTVVAGAVVPANAAMAHHRHYKVRRHHRHK